MCIRDSVYWEQAEEEGTPDQFITFSIENTANRSKDYEGEYFTEIAVFAPSLKQCAQVYDAIKLAALNESRAETGVQWYFESGRAAYINDNKRSAFSELKFKISNKK